MEQEVTTGAAQAERPIRGDMVVAAQLTSEYRHTDCQREFSLREGEVEVTRIVAGKEVPEAIHLAATAQTASPVFWVAKVVPQLLVALRLTSIAL